MSQPVPRAVATSSFPPTERGATSGRRWVGRALLIVPSSAAIAVDVRLRHSQLGALESADLLFYLLSAALGVLLCVGLLAAASTDGGWPRWGARVFLLFVAFLAVGGQFYTYGRYQAYVNHRAVLVGTSLLPSVTQQLWFDRWTVLVATGPWLTLAVAMPLALAKLAPTKRSNSWLALDVVLVVLLASAFISPERGAEQGQTPDVMYLSALGQLSRATWDHNELVERAHPGPRTPEKVAAMHARPTVIRNVVFVITESVRAESICLDPAEACTFTPFSNAAAPNRFPFSQMRALDSTTAVSVAVMWTGLGPMAPRNDFHTAPLLWEYTKAAGLESAYYTSQNLLFGNSGTWLEGAPFTRHVSATMLEPDATYETGADDGRLVDYTLRDLVQLREPYVAVVHLSNTHFPYKIDPDFMPFTPKEAAVGERADADLLDRYQDSIILQDRAVGKLVSGIRARPEGARTVVLFVSDHGEQLHEKGGMGHTGTLFEQEVRVPFWVDAPKGTLTGDEASHLRALRSTPLTQLDVLPTVLDLMGLWDAPEVAPFKTRMYGASLLRGGSDPTRPVAMSNCTTLWACAFKNWGGIAGTRKLIARQGDRAWSCFDVASDPKEDFPLDVSSNCSDLVPFVETAMGGRPF